MITNEEYDKHLLDIADENKDIYRVFKSIIGKHDLNAIMIHIFKHVEYDTYNRKNTIREQTDYSLLELMQAEVLNFIDNNKIDYSTFKKANIDTQKLFNLFCESKLADRKLAQKLQEHERSNIMWGVLKIILWHNLALQAYANSFYLLAHNQYSYCDLMMSSLHEFVWHETPYQEHTQTIRYKALDLAEIIWSYDTENILLRKHVAELITQIMHDDKLSLTQVDNWLKQSEVVPQAIIERYKNNDYGNTKSVKRQREILKAEIIYTLNDYDCKNV
ncbi:hypothetical protein [Psychrobacter pacificensis]|uniref:hypothetical protein n=1 Tax=Psychrobacter pacificensis TaxID=112002 RepID=UPI001CC139D9|nr:hypothetical protein [Psychrobacter pacificensis]MBZ1393544.1 hypothetical protein [Psychrobacter pacificensis]